MDTKEKIQNKLEVTSFSATVIELGQYSSSVIKKMQKNNIVVESSMDYQKIQFNTKLSNISEVRVYSSENICYIQSFEIEQPYQNDGLGTLIFQYLITEIIPRSNNTIYINPTEKPMKIICKKFNFSKSEKINGWYVN